MKPSALRNALVLALGALFLFAAGSVWLGLYPPVRADLAGVADFAPAAARVAIPVGADDHVDGYLLPGTRRTLVVLLPGYARDHRRMARYARFVAADGLDRKSVVWERV